MLLRSGYYCYGDCQGADILLGPTARKLEEEEKLSLRFLSYRLRRAARSPISLRATARARRHRPAATEARRRSGTLFAPRRGRG